MNAYFPNGFGFWDNGTTIQAIRGNLWRIPMEFTEFIKTPTPENEGALCVIVGPSMQNRDERIEITKHIQRLPWKLVIHGSDESHEYDSTVLGAQKTWMQYPTEKHHGDRNVLIGWACDTKDLMPARKPLSERQYDWAFSGQVNHAKREDMVRYLSGNGKLIANQGFNQGVPREEHLRLLTECKIAPCPSGTVHPDSFRFAEALEAGCLPVVDSPAWWEWMGVPVRAVSDWSEFPAILKEYGTVELQREASRIGAFWQSYKRQYAMNLYSDLCEVSGTAKVVDPLTVVMFTSVMPSCPDTHIPDQTIESVRRYTDADILLLIDGLRDDTIEYEEYKRRLLESCNKWKNVLPVIFDTHQHQTGMMLKALEMVKTPNLLVIEHDCPLFGSIPVSSILKALERDDCNSVRLYHYEKTPPEHEYMFGGVQDVDGVPMRKTFQWSQRPHFAKKKYYEKISKFFGARDFIEEIMHPMYGGEGWTGWEGLWTYYPDGGALRSLHSDGRHA